MAAGDAARDDERDAGLVDQDRVGLVDERDVARSVRVLAMHLLPGVEAEAVAEQVEARLLGGDVGDVAGVGGAALGRPHRLLHVADAHAQKLVDRPHPGGVAARQVVVEGEDVDAAAGEGGEEGRGDGGERLALAGLHLDDAARVQREARGDLHVVGALPERAAGGLAGESEGFDEQRVLRLAGASAAAQGGGAGGELAVAKREEVALGGGDRGDAPRPEAEVGARGVVCSVREGAHLPTVRHGRRGIPQPRSPAPCRSAASGTRRPGDPSLRSG